MLTILKHKIHKGIILDVSGSGFDAAAATFGTLYYDEDNPKEYLLLYTGASDIKWSRTSLGLATSSDGLSFSKLGEPVLSCEELNFKEIVTPTVFRVGNYFYMAFAGRPFGKGRRICLAYSDDPKGPWSFIRVIAEPEYLWEGNNIDLGPSTVKVDENEVLIYYSNVDNKLLEKVLRPRYWLSPVFWLRRIGILKLKINSPKNVEVYKFKCNPLKQLNGPKGSWNESLFCPGVLKLGDNYYLFPSASTYSIGFPYKQYIGMAVDSTPYFTTPRLIEILIDGPREKEQILPNIRSEIALDTPAPIIVDGKLYLYYAVMDRADGLWKTALTIFPLVTG